MTWYTEGGYLPPECGPKVLRNEGGCEVVLTADQIEHGQRYIQDTYGDTEEQP